MANTFRAHRIFAVILMAGIAVTALAVVQQQNMMAGNFFAPNMGSTPGGKYIQIQSTTTYNGQVFQSNYNIAIFGKLLLQEVFLFQSMNPPLAIAIKAGGPPVALTNGQGSSITIGYVSLSKNGKTLHFDFSPLGGGSDYSVPTRGLAGAIIVHTDGGTLTDTTDDTFYSDFEYAGSYATIHGIQGVDNYFITKDSKDGTWGEATHNTKNEWRFYDDQGKLVVIIDGNSGQINCGSGVSQSDCQKMACAKLSSLATQAKGAGDSKAEGDACATYKKIGCKGACIATPHILPRKEV